MNRISQISRPVRFTVVIACGIAAAAYAVGCTNGPRQQASNTKRHTTPSEALANRDISQSRPRFDASMARSYNTKRNVQRETQSTASYRSQPDDENPFLLLKRSRERYDRDPFLELQNQQAAKERRENKNPIVPASGRKAHGDTAPANPFDIIKQNRTAQSNRLPQRTTTVMKVDNREVDIPNLDTNPNHFGNRFDRGLDNLQKQVDRGQTQTPSTARTKPAGNPFARYESKHQPPEPSNTVKTPSHSVGRVRISALPVVQSTNPERKRELPVNPTKLTRVMKPPVPTIGNNGENSVAAKTATERTISQGDPSMIVDSKRLSGVPLRPNPIGPVFKNPPPVESKDFDIRIIPRRTSSSPAIMRPQQRGDNGPVTLNRLPKNDSRIVPASAVRSEVASAGSKGASKPKTLDQLTTHRTAVSMEWVAKNDNTAPISESKPEVLRTAPPMPVELPAPLKTGQPHSSTTVEQQGESAATPSGENVAATTPPEVANSGEQEDWSVTAMATVTMLLLLVLLAAFRHRRRVVRI